MIIRDNVVSEQYQQHIQSIITNTDFPWTFLPEVTTYNSEGGKAQSAFSHIAFSDRVISKYYDIFYSLLLSICGQIKFSIKDLYRIRIGCLLQTNIEEPNNWHIDYPTKHYTMLYYINNCDGDTYLKNNESYTRISPKAGRVLLFDGPTLHASSNPVSSPYRFVITFNFTGQFYENSEDIPN